MNRSLLSLMNHKYDQNLIIFISEPGFEQWVAIKT